MLGKPIRYRLASVACALSIFVLHPSWALSGCFLRCPTHPRQGEFAPRVEQTVRLVHPSGTLELEIDDVRMKASVWPTQRTPWIRTAEAMPSCPRITDGAQYAVDATLTANWIPADGGDEVTLADAIPLHTERRIEVAPTWFRLKNRFVKDQGVVSDASWDLAFSRDADRYVLKRVQLGGLETRWSLLADGETISALTVGASE